MRKNKSTLPVNDIVFTRHLRIEKEDSSKFIALSYNFKNLATRTRYNRKLYAIKIRNPIAPMSRSSSRSRSRRRSREEKRSCCTWPSIFCFVLALAIAASLLWWFEPWKSVQLGLNGNEEEIDSGSDGVTPIVIDTPPPTATPRYEFMQCDPNRPGQADCCNGLEGICDQRANEIMYATLHNGMAAFETGFLIGPNHQMPLEEALEAGYRGLNLDICNCGGEITFCHGESTPSCRTLFVFSYKKL